jgi:hypothetical protein
MVKNVGDIQGGMTVYGLDGQRIGIVTDVWLSRSDPDTPDVREPVSVPLPLDRSRLEQEGSVETEQQDTQSPLPAETASADSAEIAPTHASTSYFQVEAEDDVFYVPFSAVTSYFPGQSVTIDCTVQECSSLYQQVPD